MSSGDRNGALKPERILILRALQLGDLLCAVPAFRALRAAFPQASITLLGLPWSKTFVQRFGAYLDDFIPFPGFPGFPEVTPQLSQIPDFISSIQQQKFDLALQMQGSGEISNPLVQLFAARRSAGFYRRGQYCPDPRSYLDYPQDEAEVWRHLRLMEFLGLPLQGADLEFPLTAGDWLEAESLIRRWGLLPGTFACVHAGARSAARRWPVDRFAAVIDGLADRGLQVVLTGSEEEVEQAFRVASAARVRVVNLAGCTSLGGLAALLSVARLLVSNDTGVSHLAAATKTPGVILFPASDPQRWAPLNRSRHRALPDAGRISPKEVLEQVDSLLLEARTHAVP